MKGRFRLGLPDRVRRKLADGPAGGGAAMAGMAPRDGAAGGARGAGTGRRGGRGRCDGRPGARAAGVLAAVAAVPAPAAGQDAAVAFVDDIYDPALALVRAVCVFAGIAFMLRAGFRLVRRAQDRFGPGLHGTALQGLAAAIMVNLAIWLEAGGRSLFGAGRPSALSLDPAAGADPSYDALLAALNVVVFLVGVVAFARGVALLPVAADGRATLGQAAWHIVGGLLCCNFASVVGAVQTAAGVAALEIR